MREELRDNAIMVDLHRIATALDRIAGVLLAMHKANPAGGDDDEPHG